MDKISLPKVPFIFDLFSFLFSLRQDTIMLNSIATRWESPHSTPGHYKAVSGKTGRKTNVVARTLSKGIDRPTYPIHLPQILLSSNPICDLLTAPWNRSACDTQACGILFAKLYQHYSLNIMTWDYKLLASMLVVELLELTLVKYFLSLEPFQARNIRCPLQKQ